jgi:adenine-specific DNA-methyltransferase
MPKLDWLTRSDDEKTAASVPYRLLKTVPELSYGDPNTENRLIQKNNLETLKALVPPGDHKVRLMENTFHG